ncbi:hypothetical protein LA303_07540 [Candidatus Sulfidibacterium hydrothermale]|uniref:hypothetical protein n=1 Tax=Candidatus Sulfidibacterium hydrothermale TaxID=2875962 RepID=UPI001F0A2AE9|nr:hypothetical protein [Candidatus Sulfidibacterium hydrothermale]UBM61275.1 hypothetical protein LA303_07540 [Candidatus Sulfidibacterium hydrothermale]
MYKKLLKISHLIKRLLLVSLFLILVTGFESCKTIAIESASRNLVYPGVPRGKIYMNFSVVFSSKDNFSIKRVMLGDSVIKRYSLQDLKTQVFLDIKKNQFGPGKFKLIFKSYDLRKNKKNQVFLTIVRNGRPKTISAFADLKKPVYRR